MASGARGPILAIASVVALGASALAGVGIGNYTIAGTSSFYSENYRATTSARHDDGTTATAFWDSQGMPGAGTSSGYSSSHPADVATADTTDIAYRP